MKFFIVYANKKSSPKGAFALVSPTDGRRKNCLNAVFSRRHNEAWFCKRDEIEAQQNP